MTQVAGYESSERFTPISLDSQCTPTGPAPVERPAADARSVLTLVHDEYLFREGDPKRHLYRVETGAICVTSRGPQGAPELIELAFPGDLIGIGFLDEHAQSAAALVDSSVSLWPLSAQTQLCQVTPGAKERQAAATEREFTYRRRQLMASAAKGATDRVAAFLMSVSRLNEIEGRSPDLIPENLRSGIVADFLSMDVETLGRSLVELQRLGLVSQRANGGLRLDKRAELDRYATVAA